MRATSATDRAGGILVALAVCLAVSLSTSACRDPDPSCARIQGDMPGKLTFAECSDGKKRELGCFRVDPTEDWNCTCEVNGRIGRSFNWPAKAEGVSPTDEEAVRDLVRRQCEWGLSRRR